MARKKDAPSKPKTTTPETPETQAALAKDLLPPTPPEVLGDGDLDGELPLANILNETQDSVNLGDFDEDLRQTLLPPGTMDAGQIFEGRVTIAGRERTVLVRNRRHIKTQNVEGYAFILVDPETNLAYPGTVWLTKRRDGTAYWKLVLGVDQQKRARIEAREAVLGVLKSISGVVQKKVKTGDQDDLHQAEGMAFAVQRLQELVQGREARNQDGTRRVINPHKAFVAKGNFDREYTFYSANTEEPSFTTEIYPVLSAALGITLERAPRANADNAVVEAMAAQVDDLPTS